MLGLTSGFTNSRIVEVQNAKSGYSHKALKQSQKYVGTSTSEIYLSRRFQFVSANIKYNNLNIRKYFVPLVGFLETT